jgi:hypothetical protein
VRTPLAPLALALAAAILAGPAAAQVVVRAALEPPVIGLGETATFMLEVQSHGLTGVRFDPTFTLENLEIVAGPAQSEDVSFGNGSLARAYRQTWLLRPRATGPARVRGIALKLLDRVVPLADREIQVRPQPGGGAPLALPGGTGPDAGGEPANPRGGGSGRNGWPDPEEIFERLFGGGPLAQPRSAAPSVFLRSEVEPSQPLVGQQVLYSLYVYTRQDLAGVSEKEQPTFHGFWVRDVGLPEHLSSDIVAVDGVRYTRVPLQRKVLFPLRPGRHVLEAASADVVVDSYDPGFFAPPVPRSQLLHLTTPPTIVEVQPLPPAPPGFGGAVGQLRLQAHLAPGSLPLGGATAVTVRLSGIGNLQGIPAPRLDAPATLTVSPPEQNGADQVAGTTVQGQRTWTYLVVPHRAGQFPLRVSAVPYFDPVQRAFRLAMTPPLTLTILPAAPAEAAAPPASAGDPPGANRAAAAGGRRGADARDGWWGRWARWAIWRGRAGELRLLRQAWEATGWPGRTAWGLSLGCALALLTVVYRRRGLSAGGARQLERRLAEAAAATRPRRVAAEVEEGWRDFLAGRGELPPGAPAARWPDLVRARQWPREAADELARLAEDIAYLRQAPQLSATDELRGEIVARSRRLLRRLR